MGGADEAGGEIGDAFGEGGDQVLAGASEEEDAFNRALEEFDELMSQEQETLARTGGTTAADEALGQAAGGSGVIAGLPDAGGAGEADTEGGGVLPGAGSSAAPTRVSRAPDIPDEPPATVEGCEDDDRVARQLCEAATEENDPFLRAALWEEYSEYLKIIARE